LKTLIIIAVNINFRVIIFIISKLQIIILEVEKLFNYLESL
jgi:hypothetical protein